MIGLIEWLTGVRGPVLVVLVVLCVLVDIQIARVIGRLVKTATKLGDELGRGGFGLVSPRLARHLLHLVARYGRRGLLLPWALCGLGLVVWRLGVWAPFVLVLVMWLRARRRRY